MFGHVWLEIEPNPGGGVEFDERIVGGSVPKGFFPGIEKGIREAAAEGVIAGYPLSDFQATLYDGSFHNVDSNELSFKIASSMALKKGVLDCRPALLEPIMAVEVRVPEAYMGDVNRDLNTRRGRVLGMDTAADGMQVVSAHVPQSELFIVRHRAALADPRPGDVHRHRSITTRKCPSTSRTRSSRPIARRPRRPAPTAAIDPSAMTRPGLEGGSIDPSRGGAGQPIPNALIEDIRRDLQRGRRIVRLTWVAALASLVLGLVAIRQTALLVAIDRRLVTTEEVEAAGGTFDAARFVLILAVVTGGILAVRWLRDAVPVFAQLRLRGVVEGPPVAPGLRAGLGLLVRPSGVPPERAGWADVRAGSGVRVALLTIVVVAAALILGLAAALLLGSATDADTSRRLRFVSGIDGGLWLVASVLLGVTVDGIRWREAAAARALGIFIPLVDAPSRALVRLIPPVLIFLAGTAVASGRPDPWFVPCPDATFACDGMLVPVDHDARSAATIWIVYAVHHAAGPPVGTLAYAVGGPGSSGLEAASDRIRHLDPTLVRRYDILFWDPRGVGASEGRDCPQAGSAYEAAGPGPDPAEVFAGACLIEAGVQPGDVARYATHQAAEDLESIRDRLGVPGSPCTGRAMEPSSPRRTRPSTRIDSRRSSSMERST